MNNKSTRRNTTACNQEFLNTIPKSIKATINSSSNEARATSILFVAHVLNVLIVVGYVDVAEVFEECTYRC